MSLENHHIGGRGPPLSLNRGGWGDRVPSTCLPITPLGCCTPFLPHPCQSSSDPSHPLVTPENLSSLVDPMKNIFPVATGDKMDGYCSAKEKNMLTNIQRNETVSEMADSFDSNKARGQR